MQGCTIPLIFKHFFTTGLTLSLLYCTVLFYPKAKNVYSAEPVRLPWARKKVARCLPDSQYFVLITLNANTECLEGTCLWAYPKIGSTQTGKVLSTKPTGVTRS